MSEPPYIEAGKEIRRLRGALSSCWRVVRHKKLTDKEKLEHIDRIAREASPPRVIRV